MKARRRRILTKGGNYIDNIYHLYSDPIAHWHYYYSFPKTTKSIYDSNVIFIDCIEKLFEIIKPFFIISKIDSRYNFINQNNKNYEIIDNFALTFQKDTYSIDELSRILKSELKQLDIKEGIPIFHWASLYGRVKINLYIKSKNIEKWAGISHPCIWSESGEAYLQDILYFKIANYFQSSFSSYPHFEISVHTSLDIWSIDRMQQYGPQFIEIAKINHSRLSHLLKELKHLYNDPEIDHYCELIDIKTSDEGFISTKI